MTMGVPAFTIQDLGPFYTTGQISGVYVPEDAGPASSGCGVDGEEEEEEKEEEEEEEETEEDEEDKEDKEDEEDEEEVKLLFSVSSVLASNESREYGCLCHSHVRSNNC
eukprot:g5652.t1